MKEGVTSHKQQGQGYRERAVQTITSARDEGSAQGVETIQSVKSRSDSDADRKQPINNLDEAQSERLRLCEYMYVRNTA